MGSATLEPDAFVTQGGGTSLEQGDVGIRQAIHEAVAEQMQHLQGSHRRERPRSISHQSIQEPPPQAFWSDADFEREIQAFTELEIEEVTQRLEQQLYEEVIQQQLDELEWQEAQAVQEASLLEPCLQQGEEGAVLCPCCRSANLVHLHGHITCPHERWQLDVRSEGFTLEHLRQQLANAYQEHAEARQCPRAIEFRLGEVAPGFLALIAHCSQCQMLHIVA